MTKNPHNTNCEAGSRPDLATLLAACLARRRLASSPRPRACDSPTRRPSYLPEMILGASSVFVACDGSWQHVVDDAPQLAPGSLQAALVAARGVGADVTQDGVAAELAAYFGSDNKRVGLALPHPELGDVVLYIPLVVISVARIIESTAARRFQVVNLGEIVGLDEIGVEPETLDDQIIRRPTDCSGQIVEVAPHRFADEQAAWIMVVA
jgi:hypothetical protein